MFFTILVILVVATILPGNTSLLGTQPTQISNSQLNTEIEKKDIKKLDWQQGTITGTFNNGVKFEVTTAPEAFTSQAGADLKKQLDAAGIDYSIKPPPISTQLLQVASYAFLPLVFLGFLYFLVLRPAQMGGNQAMSFGRSKARRVGETSQKVTFDDVAGIDEAKQELSEIVDFLKNTKKYAALG